MDNIIIKTEIEVEQSDEHLQDYQDTIDKSTIASDENVNIEKHVTDTSTAPKPPKNQFPCPVCHLEFDTTGKRKHHKTIVHEEPRYECKDCGEKFHYIARWRNHTVTHEPGRKSRRTLKPKVQPRDNGYVGRVVLEDTVTNIKTEITTEDTVLQPQDHQLKPKKNRNKQNVSYSCPNCDEVFSTLSKLYYHKIRHQAPKFECTECGKKYHQKYSLQIHTKHHEWKREIGEKPRVNTLLCPVCKETFDTPAKMKHHKLIAHGEARYGCKICGTKFYYSAKLRSHLVLHDTGRKPRKMKRLQQPNNENNKKDTLEDTVINIKTEIVLEDTVLQPQEPTLDSASIGGVQVPFT